MFDDIEETISISAMQELLRDIEVYCESGADFSLVDLVESHSISKGNREVLMELVRHHYSMLKERRPDLSLDAYESLFPQHSEWSQLLNDTSKLGTGDTQTVEVDFDGVPEFLCGPLEDLSSPMQHALLAKMERVSFSQGEVMISEGTLGDCLLVCTSGSANVSIENAEEGRIELGQIFPGHVFGEMALMGAPTRTATVTANEDVEALKLSQEDFHSLCSKHQAFAHVITMIIADRLGRRAQDALSTVTLDGYKIRKRLGRGGMAVVYDAMEVDTGRRVALKMMSHRLAFDDEARNWFHREADIISDFHHPRIPELFNRFDAFATSFIVMEYVEGISLAQVIKNHGPLTNVCTLRMLAQLAEALQYAHAQGIVHRDVKPSNGMLDRSGNVKLMDFGLSLPSFNNTKDHVVKSTVGTPAYISPEQLAGRICPEGDWFSLGLVGVELLTGEKVFRPKNLLQLARQYENWSPDQILSQLPECGQTLRNCLESLLSVIPQQRGDCLPELLAHSEAVDVCNWTCWE